jgi:Domain of unknown function (DUF4388)
MKTQGSLADRDFPDLLHALHEQHWSGLLTLTHMGVGRSMSVQEGRLVFASSSSPDDRLGELLLRQGRLSLRQYVDAGRALAPGKRFGTVLVEEGILSPKDLVKTVVEHTQEIIYGAFQWTEGQYRMQEGASSAEAITLKISTPDIILEGVRRIESWTRITRGCGGISARYERAPDYEAVLPLMNLSFEKLSLLTALNDVTEVEGLCRDSSLSDYDVCRTLWAFRVIGIIRRVDAPLAPLRPMAVDEGLDMVLPAEET